MVLSYLALAAIGAGTCPVPTDGQTNCGGTSSPSCSNVNVPFDPQQGSRAPKPGDYPCVQISTPNDRKPKTCQSSGGTVQCSEDDSAAVVRHYDVYTAITAGTPPHCVDCDLQHAFAGCGESVPCPTATTVPNTEDQCKPASSSTTSKK
jgi:hypothetical protein